MLTLESFKMHSAVNTEQVVPELRERTLNTLTDPRLGMRVKIISGYRSNSQQRWLYDRWIRGEYNVPVVARPGFSKHETGNAVDLAFVDSRNKDWPLVLKVATEHGLRRPLVVEPWHYELNRSWVPSQPVTPTPTLPKLEERNPMFLVKTFFLGDKNAPMYLLVTPFLWSVCRQEHTVKYYRDELKYPVYTVEWSNTLQLFPQDKRGVDI